MWQNSNGQAAALHQATKRYTTQWSILRSKIENRGNPLCRLIDGTRAHTNDQDQYLAVQSVFQSDIQHTA